MHITCDMAMDLAGLYKDGLASADSTRAVEQHLKECPSCRRYYRNFRPESQHSASQVKITGQLPAEPIEQEWADFSHRINRHRLFFRLGTLAAVFVGFAALIAGLALVIRRDEGLIAILKKKTAR